MSMPHYVKQSFAHQQVNLMGRETNAH